MKKLIIIILLLPAFSFADIGGHIEFGSDVGSSMSYTNIKLQYQFNMFNCRIIPYGNQITWFYQDYSDITKGYPFRDIYIIGTEIKYMNVVFGAEHFCSHAVSSGAELYSNPDDPPLANNLTKVFVRYEF